MARCCPHSGISACIRQPGLRRPSASNSCGFICHAAREHAAHRAQHRPKCTDARKRRMAPNRHRYSPACQRHLSPARCRGVAHHLLRRNPEYSTSHTRYLRTDLIFTRAHHTARAVLEQHKDEGCARHLLCDGRKHRLHGLRHRDAHTDSSCTRAPRAVPAGRYALTVIHYVALLHTWRNRSNRLWCSRVSRRCWLESAINGEHKRLFTRRLKMNCAHRVSRLRSKLGDHSNFN